MLAASAVSAQADDLGKAFDSVGSRDSGITVNTPAVPVPVADKAASRKASVKPGKASTAPKKWTVMVFLNAKNNLELAGLYNVNQMEKVGSDSNVNIVVDLGRMSGQEGDTDLDGNWTGARRILVTKDKDEEHITSPVVAKTDSEDMGDYKRVVDFVTWAKKNYPARRYMLILWDHGSGWLDPQQKKKSTKGISFDDQTGNYIRTKQIGDILKEAGKVDVLAFDACLMQMGEVASEVAGNTDLIIGSEETVPGQGYPYASFLGALAKNPDMTNTDLGRTVVGAYKAFYSASAKPKAVQLSAINSSKLAGLNAMVKDFAASAKALNEPDAFKAARTGVIRYDMLGAQSDPAMTISFYGDLDQYLALLAGGLKGTDANTAAVKAKAGAIRDYIERQLVVSNAAIGTNRAGHNMTDSHGISVYLPPAEVRIAQAKLEGIFEGSYTNFEFDKATGWHDYVTYLYGIK
jgi:hypothetical protein